MKEQRPFKRNGRTQIHPLSVHFYLQQYRLPPRSEQERILDLFHQKNSALKECESNSSNRIVMRKLNTQVAIEIQKNERSVGIAFNKAIQIDVWNENGEFLYTWSPEIDTVYNIYVDYMLKIPARLYIKTNEGTSFVLDATCVRIAYDME